MTRQEEISIRVYLDELSLKDLSKWVIGEKSIKTHMINSIVKSYQQEKNEAYLYLLLKEMEEK